MSQEVVFETERLVLCKMTGEDIPNLMRMFRDSEVMRFYDHLFTEEEAQGWLQKILSNYAAFGAGLWACYLKSTGEFVGQCGLHFRPNFDGRDEVEVGYMFCSAYWNRGLATEAALATMQYAREKLGIGRLISLIRPDNSASRKVAEKNGMVVEKRVEYKGIEHLVYVSE